jgi:hypothetical protein
VASDTKAGMDGPDLRYYFLNPDRKKYTLHLRMCKMLLSGYGNEILKGYCREAGNSSLWLFFKGL